MEDVHTASSEQLDPAVDGIADEQPAEGAGNPWLQDTEGAGPPSEDEGLTGSQDARRFASPQDDEENASPQGDEFSSAERTEGFASTQGGAPTSFDDEEASAVPAESRSGQRFDEQKPVEDEQERVETGGAPSVGSAFESAALPPDEAPSAPGKDLAAGSSTVASPEAAATPAPASSGRRPARLEQLEHEGEAAADFLERLLDIADLDGDIEVDIDGDRAAVAVVDSEEGRAPRRLVGPDGRVLEALQELTRLAVETVTGERSRLMLDVAGFRAQRRAELVELAQAAIAEVEQSGQEKALADMTAFERKVVHDEVSAAGLNSESEGVEPNRHIVIAPR